MSPKKSAATSTFSTDSATASTTTSGGLFAKKEKATPDLYVATARLCESRSDFSGAEAQYEKALKESPNYVPALLSYAHLMDHQIKLAEATKLYERAIKANPKEAAAYNDLGLCVARRGMAAEAQTNLMKAVQLQPEKALYRNNLATLLVDQNKPDEALAQLKAVNNEAIANYDLAILLEQRGQIGLAQAHFQHAVELDPAFAEARQWSQQIAARIAANPAPATPVYEASTNQQLRMASVQSPKYGSYGIAPVPPASNRIPTQAAFPNIAQTPQNVPPLNNDLRALPPVQ
jgi:Flp pilus assembly protein TadD